MLHAYVALIASATDTLEEKEKSLPLNIDAGQQ
jgi:hypothetical protein